MIEMFATILAMGLTLPVVKVGETTDWAERQTPGRVVPVAQVDIRPQVSGEILAVAFSNGQSVAQGDVLYRLDPVKYVAVEKNAAAKVAESKASQTYAAMTVERYETLVKTRAVSQDDLDRARATRDSTKAVLEAAEADLIAAQDDVRHCTIVAPISGSVGSTLLTEGNYVQKGGDSLVTLVQTDPIRVCFELSSADYDTAFGADAERFRREGIVRIRRVSGGEVLATGRVEYVENLANVRTDSIKAYVLLDNPKGLFVGGQTVISEVSNSQGVRLPTVPANAVAQDLRGAYVWVLDKDGRATKRRIVRGACMKGVQLVREGVKPGETVVADGVHRVLEGMTVIPEGQVQL